MELASAGKIPEESKALSLLAPAPTMTSLMPGAGLLPIPTPNPLTTVSSTHPHLKEICVELCNDLKKSLENYFYFESFFFFNEKDSKCLLNFST